MIFSSTLFLAGFLPIFLVIYHLSPHRLRNTILLLASLIFYTWGAPDFILILLASLLTNFFIVQAMSRTNKPRRRKPLLISSLLINVGLLAYFKYANFLVDNVNFILQQLGFNVLHWLEIALPIGISFFTFQSLTYTLDVYRKVHEPLNRVQDYLLYILMFPQLIAGPIVRFHTVADDILDRRHNDTSEEKLHGIFRFIIGLSKKVLLANVLGEQADSIFASNVNELSPNQLWLGIVAYSFQIYFDFSGYSDMAIGLGRIIGFRFPENFNNPYVSQNITEFWRRWHITLGEWMKDYLYIPLGGNRVKTVSRLYFNLFVVFLISGLWHGANWTFVIWGAWHGLFLMLDRAFWMKWLKPIGKFPRIVLNYFIVLIGWVFFRAESLAQAIDYLRGMFRFSAFETPSLSDSELTVSLLLAFFFAFITLSSSGLKLEAWFYREKRNAWGNLSASILFAALFILSLAYVVGSDFNPFIYFRF